MPTKIANPVSSQPNYDTQNPKHTRNKGIKTEIGDIVKTKGRVIGNQANHGRMEPHFK